VVRPYAPADLDACRALWAELTQWHRELYDRPEIGGADPGRAFDAHLERVGPDCVWVAEADREVVGLAALQGDELEPIVVRGDRRGAGFGRALARAVIEAARARGLRRLRVRPVGRNDVAIAFFHDLGFEVLARVDLQLDLVHRGHGEWRPAEPLAGRQFRV
jgi:GNAT superfamily N-acetyltransferase